MSAYVDCVACACLIRSREPSCPFCGASQRPISVASTWPGLGLVIGLSLASFSCTGGEGGTGSTVADSADDADSNPPGDSQEADAVTYAGPDPWGTTTITTNDSLDTQEADAVTYAGPDESTTVGDSWTTTSGTTDATVGTTATTDSGEPCVPITEDPSGIGSECSNDGDCLDGYTCQAFQGIVLQMTCQVLCEQTCECPAGLACIEVADKSGVAWQQCG